MIIYTRYHKSDAGRMPVVRAGRSNLRDRTTTRAGLVIVAMFTTFRTLPIAIGRVRVPSGGPGQIRARHP